MASNTEEKLLMCPQCNNLMSLPIYQCEDGHSICGKCANNKQFSTCVICSSSKTSVRSIQLEQIIESMKHKLKVDCSFKYKGCTYKVKSIDKSKHENECRYNRHKCEGKKFLNLTCPWNGSYDDIVEHFRNEHAENSLIGFKSSGRIKFQKHKDYKNLQVIDFSNGKNVFYYKTKIDSARQKAFFWFNMVGLENLANHYFYEFEIYNGEIKKAKFTNYCNSHAMTDEQIINNENCATLSFKQLKQFTNEDNEIRYRFRIMKVSPS